MTRNIILIYIRKASEKTNAILVLIHLNYLYPDTLGNISNKIATGSVAPSRVAHCALDWGSILLTLAADLRGLH